MNDPVHIHLLPLGKRLTVERGTALQEVLFVQGVEFPCGGRGRCKGCRIKVLSGALPASADAERLLGHQAVADGWRLACQGTANGDLTLELAQWEAAILADNTVFAFTPRDGLGVAVDLGTTTIVGQLLDLSTGHVLAVRMGLNGQARRGADVMSRVEYAALGGQQELEQMVREQIGGVILELLKTAAKPPAELRDVVIVGNTVMHHLFCGINVEPLSHSPFAPAELGLQLFTAPSLSWTLPAHVQVRFLPCLGGFVGGDILAGILATNLDQSDELQVLVDLGTNGEIVVGDKKRLLCASTAAGPAFEGARISMGMRAATGAISEVHIDRADLSCRVIGHVEPRGICGSGLVDAVAAGLELGRVKASGRLTTGEELPLMPPVKLTQTDIRELQLAKGAIAAGIRMLIEAWGAEPGDVRQIYLAGAFGNYINRASAQRIGLLHFPPEQVVPAGNSALLGAKMALFNLPQEHGDYAALRTRVEHVSLNEDEQFQNVYVEEMGFPQ